MEHRVGTKIQLEVVERDMHNNCNQCFFDFLCEYGEFPACSITCASWERTDHKNIIYKEIKEK